MVNLPPDLVWTEQQIADALNLAADDIIEVADLSDEGTRDALNLLVNATMHYLREDIEHDKTQRLHEVVESCYGSDMSLDRVLEWIKRS